MTKTFIVLLAAVVLITGGWLASRRSDPVVYDEKEAELLATAIMTPTSQATPTTSPTSKVVKLPSGLEMQDLVVGTGAAAAVGNTVSVHYLGTLTNGQKFDSSYDRNEPFSLKLGAGQVIKGWDEGLVGMKVGGKRRLVIPPDLAYGSSGAGGVIPPNATLIFEVELLGIQ